MNRRWSVGGGVRRFIRLFRGVVEDERGDVVRFVLCIFWFRFGTLWIYDCKNKVECIGRYYPPQSTY